MTDETAQFLDDLKSKANCIDACHVSSFQCLRKTKSGERQQLRVELLDAGPNSAHGALRYQVVAMTADGTRSATGNPANSIGLALAFVRWGDLEK